MPCNEATVPWGGGVEGGRILGALGEPEFDVVIAGNEEGVIARGRGNELATKAGTEMIGNIDRSLGE